MLAMKKNYTLLFFILGVFLSYAQTIEKADSVFFKGEGEYYKKNYLNALAYYKEALRSEMLCENPREDQLLLCYNLILQATVKSEDISYTQTVENCQLAVGFFKSRNTIELVNVYNIGTALQKFPYSAENQQIYKDLKILMEQSAMTNSELYLMVSANIKDDNLNIEANHTSQNVEEMLNTADSFYLQQKYEAAFAAYEKVIDFLVKSKKTEDILYLNAYHKIGVILTFIGNYHKADHYLTTVKELLEKQNKGATVFYADNAVKLSEVLLYGFGNRWYAKELYLKAMDIYEKELTKNDPKYIEALLGMANIHLVYNELDMAEPYIYEATRLIQNNENSSNELNYMLSTVYLKIHDYEKALPLQLKIIKKIEEKVGRKHRLYTDALGNVALIYWKIGKIPEARLAYQQVTENLISEIKQTGLLLSEDNRESLVSSLVLQLQNPIRFFVEDYTRNKQAAANLYDIQLNIKEAALYSQKNIKNKIKGSGNATLLKWYEQLTAEKKIIAVEMSKPLNLQKELNSAHEKIKELENKILAELQSGKNEPEVIVSSKLIKESLKEDEVAMEFFTFSENENNNESQVQYQVLILSKNSEFPVLVSLFNQEQINAALFNNNSKVATEQLYRGSIVAKTGADTSAVLYNMLWKPLEKELKNIHKISYSPAGLLHRVAFAAILQPDNKNISDKYRLRQLSSTVRIKDEVENVSIESIALFGGIDYNAESGETKTDKNRWAYLPGTLSEVERIQERSAKYSKVKMFTGKNATKEHFEKLNGSFSPDILHIATHGFYFAGTNKNNLEHLYLELDNTSVIKWDSNPMNRSGLLFAGANVTWQQSFTGTNDNNKVNFKKGTGILTAYEVGSMFFPNTELVVLSACETALGDIAENEGVFGLQRAFKSAGVKYLLISLWEIPDKETAEFMDKFYENLFTLQNIENSFSSAQKYMKTAYPEHPDKWAAFVLIK
ncbi:CHAT domain-containing protein [Paenimyroides baculatum]|uniref:CHAT domain-containing protein n=2 Tax=Paenimyroides baculatum TaxID=2608000 RepID=A0A5M6CKH3_9FLAO|nr:CHAT domain-containing protein [Paenimyroides baculatum]